MEGRAETGVENEVHAACAQLRFAEGLRRRSAEARAEAAVREATSLALLEGARVAPARLRDIVMGNEDAPQVVAPDEAVALGAWRATWSLLDSLPALNQPAVAVSGGGRRRRSSVPLPARLAGWHRDLTANMVGVGAAEIDSVAIARDPERWTSLLRFLETDDGSALRLAARGWALLDIERPFETGGRPLGPLYAKWLLATSGVEPTGVAVISVLASEGPQYAVALEAVKEGHWHPWYDFVGQAIIRGCEVGQRIVRQVQAATLG